MTATVLTTVGPSVEAAAAVPAAPASAMCHVGLDVHARRSSVCILDGCGKVVKRAEVRGDWSALLGWVAKEVPRPFRACFEASCGYGYLYERLSALAHSVAVAHPGRLRLIYGGKRKNDRVDAEKLAKLLYLDAVPGVYVPSADVRAWRSLVEFRQTVVARRVAVKNRVRALLRERGVPAPAGKALWARAQLAWLRGLGMGEADALRRDLMAEELEELTARVRRVDRELAARSGVQPGVALLMTIPGVGVRTAEALSAYLADVKRFRRNRQVGSYLGLVPCQDSSAGKERLGHITGDGPATVRKLLCEAAWQGVRRSPTLRAYFERVARGDPDRRKIAIVATARHIACVAAAILRTGQAWREGRGAGEAGGAGEAEGAKEVAGGR